MTTTSAPRDYGDQLTAWEHRSAIPLLVLAALSIAILIAELIRPSTASPALEAADLVIMGIFAVEFGYRIWLVPSRLRWRYVLANPIDVLVVLVVGAQPLRLLRSARALRAFKAVRVVALVCKSSKQSINAVTRERLVYGVTIVIMSTALGAWALSFFEGGGSDRFEDFWEALWWSAALLATLGPQMPLEEPGSRVVALVLTTIGLSIVAALAATISAFFVATRAEDPDEAPAVTDHG